MNSHQTTFKNRKPIWNIVIVFLVWLAIFYAFRMYRSPQILEMPYSRFKKAVSEGEVAEVTIRGDTVEGTFKEPEKAGEGENAPAYRRFSTTLPSVDDPKLLELLEDRKVTIAAESEERSWVGTLLLSLLPWVLILGFFYYTSRKMQGRMGGGVFGFGKSKAKLYTREMTQITFDDVAGLPNTKRELREVVDFLKEPEKYRALGAQLPKGILLVGPPGTGKTLMAKATAGEAGVPFYSISGSEFIEMFVGVGASRVRDMFQQAKQNAPAIIFIDEIDSIGRVRGTGLGGGHDEREQTLNQILSEMDGFSGRESVVVMAATNRPDVLDPALVRPGRFDRQVALDLPQKEARIEILRLHAKDMPLSDDVDFASVAARAVGFSGADLRNLVNEAAILAARKGKKTVEAEDFHEGVDKVIMGIEREDFMSEEEKKVVAYHEAGHALIAWHLPGADPIRKVTIIPRGRSLGSTEQIPEEDRHNLSRSYLLNRVAILLGGRAAEKTACEEITSGAGDDLKKATQLVRRMVCQWGMSETLGPVTFNHGSPHPFLGREITEPKDFSEHTARMIDEEVRRILTAMQRKAERILAGHMKQLDALATALMERETLSIEEIEDVLQDI